MPNRLIRGIRAKGKNRKCTISWLLHFVQLWFYPFLPHSPRTLNTPSHSCCEKLAFLSEDLTCGIKMPTLDTFFFFCLSGLWMSFLSSSLLLISINLLLSVWKDCEASSQCSALQCGSCLSLTFSALAQVNGTWRSAATLRSNVDTSIWPKLIFHSLPPCTSVG